MKMKKYLLYLLVLFLSVPVFAQPGEDAQRKAGREAFEAKRKEFITKAVGLTREESQRFWPVYDELSQKRWALHIEQRNAFFNLKKKEKEGNVTALDYKKANDAQIEIEIKKAHTEKVFYNKLEKILSSEKISKFYEAEINFQNELLKQVERRGREDRPRRNQN
jgi:hypothetical protein